MAFHFTEEQWTSLSKAIKKIGGDPLDWIKAQLEADIDRIFAHQKLDEQKIVLYRRVSAAAHELGDALEQLGELGKAEEDQNNFSRDLILKTDELAKSKFAKRVNRCAEGADWTLDNGFGVYNEVVRGRPADTALPSWSRKVYSIARVERWTTEDERGRTSAAFMDLLIELAGCARTVGFDHIRDVRRALTRAIAMARAEEAEELRNQLALNELLDAIAHPEQ